jgi:hypothetical protein
MCRKDDPACCKGVSLLILATYSRADNQLFTAPPEFPRSKKHLWFTNLGIPASRNTFGYDELGS